MSPAPPYFQSLSASMITVVFVQTKPGEQPASELDASPMTCYEARSASQPDSFM